MFVRVQEGWVFCERKLGYEGRTEREKGKENGTRIIFSVEVTH